MTNLELIFVYQHVRHGARGPSSSYHSLFKDGVDEFRVSWEGEGDGELTLLGMRQQYDIGVRNRHKYGYEDEHGLKLIDFSKYDSEEVLFHVTDYNRTHQSLNSELLGMYQPGILKKLTDIQKNNSMPPNSKEWEKKSKENNELYTNILNEIESLDHSVVINNIPIFNVHPFAANRTFNLENTCKTLENMRQNNIADKTQFLYGYFLNHSQALKDYFRFEDLSYFTDIRKMNSIADHYISDYYNFKNLTEFHEETGIDLDEFNNESAKFYYNWMYNFYCTDGKTCSMDSSRLMEDLLGYMSRRIQIYEKNNNTNVKSYKAPKLVIDSGHDTTVAPMQMFMKEAWKKKPEYGIETQYCGFSCNLYFELYKNKTDNKYLVFYYMDDVLKFVFDYDEFVTTTKANIYTQEEIKNHCIENGGDEEPSKTFSESFEENTALWVGFFILCFTTLLGIIGIIILVMKIRRLNSQIDQPTVKMQELTNQLV